MPADPHPSGLDPRRVWLRYERYPYLLAKALLAILVAAAVLAVVRALDGVLVPVLASLLLAYLLDPAVDRFEARGMSRTRAIGLMLGLAIVAMGAFLLILSPTLSTIVRRVAHGLPALLDSLRTEGLPWLEATFGLAPPASMVAFVTDYGAQLKDQLPTMLSAVGSGLADVASQTTGLIAALFNLVIIPLLTFYFLRDFDRMRLASVDLLPAHNRDWVLERLERSDEVVGAWFRGQVEVALILGVLYAVGLSITFGVSGIGITAGLAIGVFAGLLNIVPYLGFVVGFGLAIGLSLLDWQGWGPVVGVGATFAVVQTLEGYVITPRIVGEKVGLSPVVVLIALLAGAELLGVVGVLLALPLAGIGRVLWPDVLAWYRDTDLYRGEDASPPA